jgi:uncharacterized Tic20 family protein
MTSYDTTVAAPLTTLEKVLAGCAHGSIILGIPFLIPFATLLFASFVSPSPYVKNQSLQAIAFHFLSSVIFGALLVVAGTLGLFGFFKALLTAASAGLETFDPTALTLPGAGLALFFVALLFACWASIIGLVAAVRSFQGRPYRYPLIGGLFT